MDTTTRWRKVCSAVPTEPDEMHALSTLWAQFRADPEMETTVQGEWFPDKGQRVVLFVRQRQA